MADNLTGNLKPIASTAKTASNGHFAGTAPTSVSVTDRVVNGAAGASSGLFSFAEYSVSTIVDQIRIHVAGAAEYYIYIQRSDGTDDLIASATGLTNVNVVYQGPLYLTGGEKIRVVTGGGAPSGVGYAKVIHRFWNRLSGG